MSMGIDSKTGNLDSNVKKTQLNPLNISFDSRNKKRLEAFSKKYDNIQILFDSLDNPKSNKVTEGYQSFFDNEIPSPMVSSWLSTFSALFKKKETKDVSITHAEKPNKPSQP